VLNHSYIHHISSEVVTHAHIYDSISELASFPASRSMGKLYMAEFVYYSLVVNCYSAYFLDQHCIYENAYFYFASGNKLPGLVTKIWAGPRN